MTLTESMMQELGTPLPEFTLPDVDGNPVSSSSLNEGSGVLVVFWCNHCPFVKHIKSAFAEFAAEYQKRGLGVVAINANDFDAYPQDAPPRMKEDIEQFGYTFPYLIDSTQEVARAFNAACTPDFFLYDADNRLVYRGQFDGSRPRNDVPVTGRDLRAAADAVLEGEPVPVEQTPSIGCNIKWRNAG